MGGGFEEPPPGKHPSGTFMSSNDLVSHQTNNKQFYDLKWSKILSNDPKNVSSHCGGHNNIKIKHFDDFLEGGGKSSRVKHIHLSLCNVLASFSLNK